VGFGLGAGVGLGRGAGRDWGAGTGVLPPESTGCPTDRARGAARLSTRTSPSDRRLRSVRGVGVFLRLAFSWAAKANPGAGTVWDEPPEEPPPASESNPIRIASNPITIADIQAIRTITRPNEGVNARPETTVRQAPANTLAAPHSSGAVRLGCHPQGKKSQVGRIKGPPCRWSQILCGEQHLERLALAAMAALLLLAATVSPAGAVVTIGSNLARVPNSAANYSPRPTFSNVSLAPNRQAFGGVSSPVNGTVVLWRIRVGDSTRVTNLRIIRPLDRGVFTGAGTSASVTPPTGATSPYAAQLPIQIGDYIGLDCCDPGIFEPDAEFFVTGNAAVRDEWQPRLVDGGAGRPPLRTNGYEIALNAEIDPTSSFALTGVTRNKRRGTATITVSVPNPGELTGSGRGVSAASISKKVRAPGRVRLLIKAKGRKRRTLNSTGKVRVVPEITYTPTGGTGSTRTVTLKLVKR
jgi:hypothetical protein